MLVAMVIIVTCLFFLGVGLLISTNALVLLSLAVVGMIIGRLAGILLFRGRVAQEYHWSIFAGPSATVALFVLLCDVLNLLMSDKLILALGAPRMYSVALLLGMAPGLLIVLILGNALGGRFFRRTAYHPLLAGGGGRIRSRSLTPAPVLRPPGSILPISPLLPLGGSLPQPGIQVNIGLTQRLASEVQSLSRSGSVQIRDLNDGTVCVIVTRLRDGLLIYMLCSTAYPQQSPVVMAERNSAPLQIGSGVLFPWDSSCRLARIVDDLYGRL
jgi:hypothetical protein